MAEYAEQLLIKRVFVNSKMIIISCLGSPAQMNRGGDIGFCPFHDLLHLVPVVYFLKRHLLNRSPRDDKSVKLLIFYILKPDIKFIQMVC